MAERHRLQIHCPNGSPSEATIRLDGEQLMFVSRVELVFDAATREASARLTIPAALLDVDVDAAAFIAAHADTTEQPESDECARCGHSRTVHNSGGELGCSDCPTGGAVYAHNFDEGD